jgi:hypothetical protein
MPDRRYNGQRKEKIMKPDFSGEYLLNRDASTLSPLGAANVQTASLRINHAEPNFGCEGRFSFLNGETGQWAFELATDGGAEGESTIEWDGSALVVTMVTGGPTITFRYELDGEGHLRLAERLRGSDHDQDNQWIFDRR